MAVNDNNEERQENAGYGRALFGRTVIYTDETEINADNVLSVLCNAFPAHTKNRCEINYLYDYYKGKQPILYKTKEVRSEINSRVVTNYANEIVSFKVGYLASEPIQYVALDSENLAVKTLNDYMYQIGKQAQDQEVIEWGHICGTAYRYVQANNPADVGKGDAPFDLFTLDPRTTAVIYSSTFKKTPMAAFTYTISATDGQTKNFVVYTKDKIFSFGVDKLGSKEQVVNGFVETINPLGEIPVYEYPANNARLGAFEIVLPLLDAINRINSNNIDAGDTQIQSFLKFINCDIDGDGLENLRAYGAIKIKSIDGAPADVDTVKTDYSYDGANITKQDIHTAILTICGMPVQSNGASISANNGAIYLANGFSQAETRAKASEMMFKGSERRMLNLVLKICKTVGKDNLSLRTSDIDYKFTRRNYENIQVKAQVLCEMLNTPRIHPKLAFEACGLFSDPENAYLMSEAHYAETLENWKIEDLPAEDGVIDNAGTEENETVRANGLTDSGFNNAPA